MPLLVAQADYNIAYMYYLRGDYSRALDMLRAVRVACGEVGDLYHAALSTLDESEIYRRTQPQQRSGRDGAGSRD